MIRKGQDLCHDHARDVLRRIDPVIRVENSRPGAWPLAVHAQPDRRGVLVSAGSESDPREQTLEASKTMKAVVIGEPSGMSMEEISKVFPRHKAVVDKFVARGDVIGIGPFADLGNMAIFKTRAAAEEFVREDPFILEGVVKPFKIRDWKDSMLPG